MPIFNLEIGGNFSIGDIEFIKFNEKIVSEIFEEVDEEELFYKYYIKPNLNHIYVKASGRGVKTTAYNFVLYKIRLAINIIKLFVHPSSFQFGIVGELPRPEYRTVFYYDEDDYTGGNRELVGLPPNFGVDKQFLENPFFKELDKIIKNANQSAFEKKMLLSIYWYGESINIQYNEKERIYQKRKEHHENLEYFKLGEGIIKLFTALESILIHNDDNIKKNVSKRGSKILSEKGEQQNYYKDRLKFLYKLRGNIVHDGNNAVLAKEFTELDEYTKNILYHIIILNKKYKFKSVKRFIKHLDGSNITQINDDLNETYYQKMV